MNMYCECPGCKTGQVIPDGEFDDTFEWCCDTCDTCIPIGEWREKKIDD